MPPFDRSFCRTPWRRLLPALLCILTPTAFAANHGISLADIGHARGIVVQGIGGEASIFFPVPRDARIGSAQVDLHYLASPILGKESNMRVSVNGTPRQAVSIAGKGGAAVEAKLAVALTPLDLQKPFVEVLVKTNFLNTDDYCADDRAHAGFLHVLPSSALNLAIDVPPQTIRGVFDTLPRSVTIATERGAGEPALLAAWRVGNALARTGRTVKFVDATADADVWIGRKAFLEAGGAKLPDNAVIVVAGTDKRRVLAIGEPFQVDGLVGQWTPLLATPAAAGATQSRIDRSAGAMPLSTFGLRNGLRDVLTTSDWVFQFSDADLPARKLPRSLRLDLVAPRLPEDRPWMLFTYLNDVLIHGERVTGGQRPVGLDVPIAKHDLTGRYNFRVVVSRQGDAGECKRHLQPLPIQMLESSRIELEERDVRIDRFAQIQGLMRTGLTVHVPKAAESSAAVLERLIVLGRTFNLDPSRVQLANDGVAPGNGKGFVWMSSQPPASLKGPISFDKGRIVIRNERGATMLDTAVGAPFSIMQIVGEGANTGVWWRPLDNRAVPTAPPDIVELTDGDVALVGQQRTELELVSNEARLIQVDYPDYREMGASWGTYKYWLFALAWLVATVLLVMIYRGMRGGRS